SKGPEVYTREEILNLAAALEKFKSVVGSYPPSRIRLREAGDYDLVNGDQLDQDSFKFLTKMLGRGFQVGTQVDWNNDGTVEKAEANGGKPWVLEGDECLVFFLQGPAGQGFPVPGNKTLGPFFTFQAGRIQFSGNINYKK